MNKTEAMLIEYIKEQLKDTIFIVSDSEDPNVIPVDVPDEDGTTLYFEILIKQTK